MTTRSRPRSACRRRDFARMSVTVSRLDSSTKIGACWSWLDAAESRLERHDVAVGRRLAHGEEQLLRVRDRGRGLFARQCEPGDLVRDADEAAEECGPLDDRGVARCVRDGRYVLHEPDEELGA